MEVTCEHCKSKLNIPDEKVPRDQRVRVSCPKCKNRMTLDTRRSASKEPSSSVSKDSSGTGEFRLKFIESKRTDESDEDAYDYRDYTEDDALGFYEEGTKLALVMENNPGQSEQIRKAIEELGYTYISAPNTRDAVGKMRFHHFDVIILSDGFDGQGLDQSPILNYLNHISMSVRRRIFLALLGEGFKTMDKMMAFAASANVIINTKEMDKLSAILKRAITDNEKFYKVFMDTLTEVGRA